MKQKNEKCSDMQKNMRPPLGKLIEYVRKSWSISTSAHPEEWNEQYPAWGQCSVSSFVIQDYYGGEIIRVRYKLSNGRIGFHSYNLLDDDKIVDSGIGYLPEDIQIDPPATSGRSTLLKVTQEIVEQQKKDTKKPKSGNTIREQILEWPPNQKRYQELKRKVEAFIERERNQGSSLV